MTAPTSPDDLFEPENPFLPDKTDDPAMQQRWSTVLEYWHKFDSVMRQTKFNTLTQTQRTADWINATKLNDRRDDERSIIFREEFFQGHGKEVINEGIALHNEFTKLLEQATPYISGSSKDRWIARYYDEKTGFQAKKYWIRKQFPDYVRRWAEAEKERDALTKDPGFVDLMSYDPSCAAILKSATEFRELHYEKRIGFLAQARAALLATSRLRPDLYAEAKKRLSSAETLCIAGQGKTGIWLERIFKNLTSVRKIEQFVRGSGGTTLTALMTNWTKVKFRYDKIASDMKKYDENRMPRGLYFLKEQQFLSLHYNQRLQYVDEMESRLNSPIIDEPDTFIRIRHAIDTKDWIEADELIQKAKTEPLSGPNRTRLASMELYLQQFRPKKAESKSADSVNEAKNKIDEMMSHVSSSIKPMILRLLRGPNANRSIHQLRWIVYNNKWCRTHGYLDDEKAATGASKDNREMTKYRADHGEDIGRNDTLDFETTDQAYFRKKEFANHKATFMHVNLDSGAPGALGEWLEHEQDTKVLYWTTFCGHDSGIPKSANWHNDLLFTLTQLRSASRTINNAGFMYDGIGFPLKSLH